MIEIRINENEANQRIDKFLRKYLTDAPLSYIYKMVRKKNIRLNGKKAKVETILKEGDVLTFYIKEEAAGSLIGKKTLGTNIRKNFKIAFEDENIIIVEKPKGLLIHGTKNEKKNTLVNQVVAYLKQNGDYDPEIEKTFIPAAVNRLDRNTSGLVIFGKNNKSLQVLNAMIRDKNIRKFYITMVMGSIKETLHVKGSIIKDQGKNKVELVRQTKRNAKEIETIFRPLKGNESYTLVEAELITGRTHQIRAQLSDSGFPILGDEKYGDHKINEKMRKTFNLKSQYLHAYKIFFQKCYPPLNYLEGREIISEFPVQLKEIEERLLMR